MFVQLLNDQILAHYRLHARMRGRLHTLVSYWLRALTLIDADVLLMPTVDLVQSPVMPQVHRDLFELAVNGLARFVGSTSDIDELIERKHRHFEGTPINPQWFEPTTSQLLRPYSSFLDQRAVNTTAAMRRQWRGASRGLAEGDSLHDLHTKRGAFLQIQLQQASESMRGHRRRVLREMVKVGDRLDGHAFLTEVVLQLGLLGRQDIPADAKVGIDAALAYAWLRTHVDEYGPAYVARIPQFGWIDCGVRFDPDAAPVMLDAWCRILAASGLSDHLIRASGSDLAAVCDTPDFTYLRAAYLLPAYRALGGSSAPGDQAALQSLHELQRVTRSPRGASHVPAIHEVVARCLATLSARHGNAVIAIQGGTELGLATTLTIFLGHGRSAVWREVKDYLEGRGIAWEEFNRIPTAGQTAKERLEGLLDDCNGALIVFTAEDDAADGSKSARANVIHEAGLFQGRLGFGRAIVLREEGCTSFSNLAGVQELRFGVGRVSDCFYDLGRVLQSWT